MRQARDMAKVTSRAGGGRVELAPEPPHGDVTWTSAFEIDPSTVPLADKVALLARVEPAPRRARRRLAHLGVAARRVGADVPGRPQRDAGHPAPGAPPGPARGAGPVGQRLRDHAHAGPAGRPGLGVPRPARPSDGAWDWEEELAQLPELLAEKLRAPSVEAGTYDLVVDPSNLWLTIHESIGHATELDRAVGYEAAYAGTSFATFDKLGHARLRLPRHARDRGSHGGARAGHRRASTREGVAAQSFDLVRDGTLVGYQLDRSIAAAMGFERSNGCAFADSPMHVPDSAHGQRVAGACGRRRPAHRGPDRRRRPGRLHRGRQELVDRHAALQLPVHRATLLPD